jgi:hypothetical protein
MVKNKIRPEIEDIFERQDFCALDPFSGSEGCYHLEKVRFGV